MNKHEKYNLLLKQFNELPGHHLETNYFEVTGYSHYENIASNVLQFFLLPTNNHGLEDLMLRSLLEIADQEFLIGGFNNVTVDREVTTSEYNRIDLVIETDEYIIAIENKIRHSLNNDLSDYEKHIENINEKNENSKKLLFLVLTPKEIKSKNEKESIQNSKFVNITYENLIAKIKLNYTKYLFSANTKFLIFFNEFLTSLEKQMGTNMKDKQLSEFFLNNVDSLEELTRSYIEFKSKLKKQKIDELKPMFDDKYTNILKNWTCGGTTLVQDLDFNGHKIAVDTKVNIKNYTITVFGRDENSNKFLRSDKFYDLTGIDKKLMPNVKERLIFDKVDFNENTDKIYESLDLLLKLLNEGVKKFKLSHNDNGVDDQ